MLNFKGMSALKPSVRERRRNAREPFPFRVSVLSACDFAPAEVRAEDLSVGGIRVVSSVPLAPEEVVQVTFRALDGSIQLQADAEVRWCKTVDEGCEAGLRFVELDPDAAGFVARVQDQHPEDASDVWLLSRDPRIVRMQRKAVTEALAYATAGER
jgi:hypothetical protein